MNSVGLGAIQLIVGPEDRAGEQARQLIRQTQRDIEDPTDQRDFIELIETIMVYKLPHRGREEIETMLGLGDLKETKVYQEAKQEARLEAIPELLRFGLTTEQIAQALKLSVEEVQQAITESEL